MAAIGYMPVPCSGIPDLHAAISSARGDIFPIGRPGDGSHRATMTSVCVKRLAEQRSSGRRWCRSGRGNNGSSSHEWVRCCGCGQLFKDGCCDEATAATNGQGADETNHKASPLDLSTGVSLRWAKLLSRQLSQET